MTVNAYRETLLVPAVELSGTIRFRLDDVDYSAPVESGFHTPGSFALELIQSMRDALPEPSAPSDYGFRLHVRRIPVVTGGRIGTEGLALCWSNTAEGLPLTILQSDPDCLIVTRDGYPLVRGLSVLPDLVVAAGSRLRWTEPGPPLRNPPQAAQFVWPQLRWPARIESRRVTVDLAARGQVQTESGTLHTVLRGEPERFTAGFEYLPDSRWISDGWSRAAATGGPVVSGAPMWLFPDALLDNRMVVRPSGRTFEIDRAVPGTRSVKLQLAVQPVPDTEIDTGDVPFTFGKSHGFSGYTSPLSGDFSGDLSSFTWNDGRIEQAGATSDPASRFVRLLPSSPERKTADALVRLKLWRSYPAAIAPGSLWEAGVGLIHSSFGGGTAVVVADTGTARELRLYNVSGDGSKTLKAVFGTLAGKIPRAEPFQEDPCHRLIIRFQLFVLDSGQAVTRVRVFFNGEGPFDGETLPPGGADTSLREWFFACANGSSPASNTFFGTVEIWDDVSGSLIPWPPVSRNGILTPRDM